MLTMTNLVGFASGSQDIAIRSTGTGSNASAVTSHAVTLPTSYAAGDLLIAAIMGTDGTWTWPAGWTELGDSLSAGVSSNTIAYRFADGTEGSTVTATASKGTDGNYTSLAISNVPNTVVPAISTAVTGGPSITGIDSGSVASTTKFYLAYFAGRPNLTPPTGLAVTSPPSGFTSAVVGNFSSGKFTSFAYQQATTSPLDPGAWTLSATSGSDFYWIAWTIGL